MISNNDEPFFIDSENMCLDYLQKILEYYDYILIHDDEKKEVNILTDYENKFFDYVYDNICHNDPIEFMKLIDLADFFGCERFIDKSTLYESDKVKKFLGDSKDHLNNVRKLQERYNIEDDFEEGELEKILKDHEWINNEM
jgi:hypothetical protein